MTTVLVTGGAGYIGSHTVRKLKAEGIRCIVADNLSAGHREAVGDVDFEQVDIGDFDAMDVVFKKYPVDAVIHFAALSLVGESVSNPQKYYENNVAGTLALLRAMHRNGVQKIVFSSTCAVYGVPQGDLNEQHPRVPVNPYGKTKRAVEDMLVDFGNAYGMKYIALRYFNAAGAAETGDIGESHTPETHLIPLVLQAIQGKRDALTVFGTDYPTADGTCIRDYVHVDDLADAHFKALEKIGDFSGFLNLGTGRGHSVKEVVAACEAVTGRKCPVIYGERRVGDPAVLCAKAQQAHRVLQWVPRYASLTEIVDTAWRWEKNKRF